MLWIVAPGAVRAAFPGQHPSIVQGIARAGHYRMVAPWNQDGVAMLDGIGMVERLRIGRIGIHPHEAKALSWLDLEVVYLFHGDLRRRHEAVMLMGRDRKSTRLNSSHTVIS